jgi:RNA polymerase sigma factor (sigma-70 family)
MTEASRVSPETDQTSERQQPVRLEHALHGVSLFLKLSDDERDALHAHFSTGQPSVERRKRQQVTTKVGLLFADYFDAHRDIFAIPAWNEDISIRQTRLQLQRGLMKMLVGDAQNGLVATPLQTLMEQRPHQAEHIAHIARDAFADMLAFYAQRHRFDQSRLFEHVAVEVSGDDGPDPEDDAPAAGDVIWHDSPSEQRSHDDIPPPLWDAHQAKLSWAPIATMSEAMGTMQEERDDSDWRPGALLRIPHPGTNRSRAFSDALNHRILDQNEILELVARIRVGQTALRALHSRDYMNENQQYQAFRSAVLGLRAKHILAYHHLRFARSLAVRYAWRGVDPDDAIQGGMVGLMRATELYDPFFIAHADGHAPESDEPTIRFGTIATPEIKSYARRAGQAALSRLFVRPDTKDARPPEASLDALYGEFGEFEIGTVTQNDDLLAVEEAAVRPAFWNAIRTQASLTPREYQALVHIYLLGMDTRTAGAAMGVTHQRVSQLESGALRKLRSLGGMPDETPAPDGSFDQVLQKMRVWFGPGHSPEVLRTWLFGVSHEPAFDDQEREIIHLSFGLGRHSGYRQTPEVVGTLGLAENRVKWVRQKFLRTIRGRRPGK